MSSVSFLKMHGIGNDFVIIDSREWVMDFTPRAVAAVADRHRGVGCDQLIIVRSSEKADCFMQIYNADGSLSATCGNATRCVAWLLMQEKQVQEISIETVAGVMKALKAEGEYQITVNMGKALLEWQDIPLLESRNTLHLDIEAGPLKNPVAVSMGNPHAVFFVENAAAIPLAEVGPVMEHHPLFPQRANIGVAQVINRNEIVLRVWERGAGETLACGSGACAAVVAASRRGLLDRKADVHLAGGVLTIEWNEDGTVWMTGPVAISFSGVISPSLIGSGAHVTS